MTRVPPEGAIYRLIDHAAKAYLSEAQHRLNDSFELGTDLRRLATGAVSLSSGSSNTYTLTELFSAFYLGFVALQYGFVKLYMVCGLQHPPEAITYDR
jgi:hypothetical protein